MNERLDAILSERVVHRYRWSYDGDGGSLPMLLCSREVAYDAIRDRLAFYRMDRVTCPTCRTTDPSAVTMYDYMRATPSPRG